METFTDNLNVYGFVPVIVPTKISDIEYKERVTEVVEKSLYGNKDKLYNIFKRRYPGVEYSRFEDIIQDVALRIVEKYDTFRRDSNVETWITSIFLNQCITKIIRGKERKELSNIDSNPDTRKISDTMSKSTEDYRYPSPEKSAQYAERVTIIGEAVLQLDPRHKDIIRGYYFEGIPSNQLARQNNISERTVRTRLFYARKRLKGLLEEQVGSF